MPLGPTPNTNPTPDVVEQTMWGVTARETLPLSAIAGSFALTSTKLYVQPVVLFAGDSLSHVTAMSDTQGTITATNWWFAVYGPTGSLVSQTPDQLTATWAANTAVKLSLNSPVVVTKTAPYFAAVYFAGTTGPKLLGAASSFNITSLNSLKTAYPSLTIPFMQSQTVAATSTAPLALSGLSTESSSRWLSLTL